MTDIDTTSLSGRGTDTSSSRPWGAVMPTARGLATPGDKPEIQYKTCSRCGVEKQLCDFFKDRSKKDGYGSHCKLCNARSAALSRVRNQNNRRLYDLLYRSRPEVQARRRQQWKKWYSSGKGKAEQRLRGAVRRHKIKRPEKCELCARALPGPQLHGHHEDYTRPLDVQWLCAACHAKRHRKYVL